MPRIIAIVRPLFRGNPSIERHLEHGLLPNAPSFVIGIFRGQIRQITGLLLLELNP
jgi:hypothetical protein